MSNNEVKKTFQLLCFIIGNSLFDIGYSDMNLPLHIGMLA